MQQQTGQTAAELKLPDLNRQIEPHLKPVLDFVKSADDAAFAAKFKVKFGSGGPKTYFYELCRIVQGAQQKFNPPGLSDHLAEMSADVIQESERRWKWINETVHDHVISVLEENYGDDFFQEAIANKEIKKKAFEKMMDYPVEDQKPLHVYLDFIQLKVIAEQKENWPLFSGTLSIQMPDEPKGRAKYLDWFDRVNKIRRVFAHSYGRKLEEDDAETLAYVEEQLLQRLPDYASNS